MNFQNGFYITDSKEYAKAAEITNQQIELAGKLGKEYQEYLQVRRTRALILQEIESATGLEFAVASNNGPTKTAAFVTTDNFRPHIVEQTLDQPDFAIHAAKHEAMHIKSRITALRASEILQPEKLKKLTEKTEIANLGEVDLMEGFNELATIEEHNSNQESGYSEVEVPAARQLEDLAQDYLGISLLKTYISGDQRRFAEQLNRLCEALKSKKFAIP